MYGTDLKYYVEGGQDSLFLISSVRILVFVISKALKMSSVSLRYGFRMSGEHHLH